MSDGRSPSEADESVVDDEKNVKAFVFFCQEGLGLPACSKTEEFGPKLAERLKAIKKTLDIQFRFQVGFFVFLCTRCFWKTRGKGGFRGGS